MTTQKNYNQVRNQNQEEKYTILFNRLVTSMYKFFDKREMYPNAINDIRSIISRIKQLKISIKNRLIPDLITSGYTKEEIDELLFP